MKNICKMSFAAAFAVAFVSCMNFLGEDMRNSYKGAGTVIQNITVCEEKTTEVVVVPKGKTITVVGDDSYCTDIGTQYNRKGAFFGGRKLELKPFAIAQYEVTQELYEKVMGTNPSGFQSGAAKDETQKLRPVENITWNESVVFCNKFSEMEGLEPCYTITGSLVTCDFSKNGYRLPTDAEWEFAARGGDPLKSEWNYKFAGCAGDTEIGNYAWYSANAGSKTHQVGLKKPNSLGLYDMCGNVWEICWDALWGLDVDTGARGPAISAGCARTWRGGAYNTASNDFVVNRIGGDSPDAKRQFMGFRLARSL